MWDSNSPLQLLNTMPKKLTKENLEKLQLVIDADKYKNSLVSGFDLCGMYAPFCRDCKKTSIYPCAIAYINMMRAGGADVEIDAKPVTATGSYAEKPAEAPQEKSVDEIEPVPPVSVEAAEETAVASTEYQSADEATEEAIAATVADEQAEEINTETPTAVGQTEQPAKRKIRIAFARKKIY